MADKKIHFPGQLVRASRVFSFRPPQDIIYEIIADLENEPLTSAGYFLAYGPKGYGESAAVFYRNHSALTLQICRDTVKELQHDLFWIIPAYEISTWINI